MLNLSIIVPCYNIEPYIERCVNSLLAQPSMTKQGYSYEIILVDDCGIDSTMQRCAMTYGQNKIIKTIQHAKNEGPGAARNTGLANSEGEYIFFVDGDDYITEDSLSYELGFAYVHDLDICLHGISHTKNNTRASDLAIANQSRQIFTGKDYLALR